MHRPAEPPSTFTRTVTDTVDSGCGLTETITSTIRGTRFVDRDGVRSRTVSHLSFDGLVTHEATGRSWTDRGQQTARFDPDGSRPRGRSTCCGTRRAARCSAARAVWCSTPTSAPRCSGPRSR